MSGPDIRHILCCLLLLVGVGACVPREDPAPPTPETEEDVITRVLIPGAYGVPGGDQTLQPSRQTSCLIAGDHFAFRMMDPGSLAVISIAGLPVNIKTGDYVSLHYRYTRRGITHVSRDYEHLHVVLVRDGMIWLKQNDDLFFVIQAPELQ